MSEAAELDIESLERDVLRAVESAADEAALEAVRVAALGKKGSVSDLLKGLGGMSPEARRTAGPAINGLKERVQDALGTRRILLRDQALEARLAAETLKLTNKRENMKKD